MKKVARPEDPATPYMVSGRKAARKLYGCSPLGAQLPNGQNRPLC